MTNILFILFIISFLGYEIANRRPAKYYWKSKVDTYIPLIPNFVFPYILFYPFLIITWVALRATIFLPQFLITVIICNCLSTLFWYLFPNGVHRPIAPKGMSGNILKYIYSHDHDTNGFPSGHVYLSIICTVFLIAVYPQSELFLISIGTLIAISTVFTKQHYAIDILGGIIFAIFSLFLGSMIGSGKMLP